MSIIFNFIQALLNTVEVIRLIQDCEAMCTLCEMGNCYTLYWPLFCTIISQTRFFIDRSNKTLMCWGTLNRILSIYIITTVLSSIGLFFFIWNIHSTIYHRVLGDNSWLSWGKMILILKTGQETLAEFRILLVVVRGRSVRTNQDGVPCPALSYLILPQLQNKIRGGIGLQVTTKRTNYHTAVTAKLKKKENQIHVSTNYVCLTRYSIFWLHLICVTLTDFTNVQRKRYHNKRTYTCTWQSSKVCYRWGVGHWG